MRELSASTFPLGETSLHLLHTPDGNMFVTADLAVKLFDSAPATFAEFVRANRYVRVNSMERAVVRLCASLGIPPETAGGDKPVSVPAGVATNDDARDAGRDGKTSSNASDAVTLLPERSVLAILVDRRDARRAAQFRESAARRSFVAAERLVNLGDFENALPLALDAVRRAQEIHETPRARRAAEANEKERVRDALEDMAASKLWEKKDGAVVIVDTTQVIRARELRALYDACQVSCSASERLELLRHLKWTVREFSVKLTKDIAELIDRESDLLLRRRDPRTMAGLRKRLSGLFLQFIETPEFNPEASRYSVAALAKAEREAEREAERAARAERIRRSRESREAC